MPEVAHFEPNSALDGGADGLGRLSSHRSCAAGVCLSRDGVAVLEIGADQAGTVVALATAAGFVHQLLCAVISAEMRVR